MHDDHTHDENCNHDHPEDKGPKCVSQFVSRNQNHKAAVYELSLEPAKYECAIYGWTDVDSEPEPLWERQVGPIVMDTLPAAETWAQKNLAIYAGEVLDTTIGDGLRSQVQEVLGHDDFDFYDPKNYEVSFLESEDSEDFLAIPTVDKVLAAGEFYFVEYKNQWLAGFLFDEGVIRCWKRFEDMKEALQTIVL